MLLRGRFTAPRAANKQGTVPAVKGGSTSTLHLVATVRLIRCPPTKPWAAKAATTFAAHREGETILLFFASVGTTVAGKG